MITAIFAICPNCSSRMKLEFVGDVTTGGDICFQTKIAEKYRGECLLCHVEMEVQKPTPREDLF